jgi:hypothetical protein
MKIIAISNANDESVSDRLVATGIKNEFEAQTMVIALNDEGGEHSADFFKAVADDHVLYTREP